MWPFLPVTYLLIDSFIYVNPQDIKERFYMKKAQPN